MQIAIQMQIGNLNANKLSWAMISITWPQVSAMSPSREIAAHLTFPLCSLVTMIIDLVLPGNHHDCHLNIVLPDVI